MINAVGSIAGFAGPYLFGYMNTRFGSFSYGLTVLAITSIAAGLLVLRIPQKTQASRI
jgi:cyanate permease